MDGIILLRVSFWLTFRPVAGRQTKIPGRAPPPKLLKCEAGATCFSARLRHCQLAAGCAGAGALGAIPLGPGGVTGRLRWRVLDRDEGQATVENELVLRGLR